MGYQYGLTRQMADAIVKAVRDDAQCRALLARVSAFKFFTPIGQAGTARNFANAWAEGLAAIQSWGMPDEAGRQMRENRRVIGDREACTGVAETTARALTRVSGKPGYEFLKDAGQVDRLPSDPPRDFHTATSVTVTGGKVYVFDWHSTLDIANPLIFPSPAAFKAGRPSVKAGLFWGWS